MNKTASVFVLTALLSAAPFAKGQTMANRVPTNLPGVTTSVAPPVEFDPLIASDQDLATYGFPPRPDEGASPDGYKSWRRAMLASKARMVPSLELTNIFHGPVRAKQVKDSTGTSSNWSGSVDFSGATSYNKSSSFYFLLTDYVVPIARQAYGACTGGWDYSSSWIGIDGYGSNDVLQAGTESDAYCSGSTTSSYYSAWYEWYPYGSVRISNFPVAPGDDLFLEVWNTSATQGYAYFVNYTTNQVVDLGFTAPSGTKLVGNSAEWVVERPGVGGGLATLTNYISDYFSNCFAYTFAGSTYEPGTSSAVQVTMLDNSGNAISYPTLLGSSAIWFQDEGSAR